MHPPPNPPTTAPNSGTEPTAGAWPSVRAAASEAVVREHADDRLERLNVADRQQRQQRRRSVAIIGSVITVGGLAWLLLTR